MKRIIVILLTTVLISQICAQTRFSYQAVVRDANNNLLINKKVGIRVRVLNEQGQKLYGEKFRDCSTDTNGVVTIEIGGGITEEVYYPGSYWLSGVSWHDGKKKYLEVAIDPMYGENYTIISKSELLKVPFAIDASYSNSLIVNEYPYEIPEASFTTYSKLYVVYGKTTSKSGEIEYPLPNESVSKYSIMVLSLEIYTGNAWYGGTSIKAGSGAVSYSISDNTFRIYHEENSYYQNKSFRIVFMTLSGFGF